jgi:hypothetical protein
MNGSSLIPACLQNNGNDKDANSAETEENARVVRLRSRRKAGELTSEKRRHKKSSESPLEFTYKKLSLYFMLPLPIAARALEISHTSLKKLCRELGIARWPYVRGRLERFGPLGAAHEGNAPEKLAASAKSAASAAWNLARIAFSNFDSTTASAASTPASTPSRISTALVRVHRGPSTMVAWCTWNLQDWSWTRLLGCLVTWRMTCQLMIFLGYLGIQLAISERAIQHRT